MLLRKLIPLNQRLSNISNLYSTHPVAKRPTAPVTKKTVMHNARRGHGLCNEIIP